MLAKRNLFWMPEYKRVCVCMFAWWLFVCLFLCNTRTHWDNLPVPEKCSVSEAGQTITMSSFVFGVRECAGIRVFFPIWFCMWVEYYSTFCLLFFCCSGFPSDSFFLFHLVLVCRSTFFRRTQMCQLIKNYAHSVEWPCSAVDEQLRNMHFNSGQMLLQCPIIRPCSNFIDLFLHIFLPNNPVEKRDHRPFQTFQKRAEKMNECKWNETLDLILTNWFNFCHRSKKWSDWLQINLMKIDRIFAFKLRNTKEWTDTGIKIKQK